VIGDGGDIVAHTAGQVRVDRPGHWMDPGPFGCLGVGAPFAMAAKHVHPDKQVLVVYGDGSFGFNGMEFESAVRQDLPFVGVVGNDGAWGEMKAFHERVYGAEGMLAQDLSQATGYERWWSRSAATASGSTPGGHRPGARPCGCQRGAGPGQRAARPWLPPGVRGGLRRVGTPQPAGAVTFERNRSRSSRIRRCLTFATVSPSCSTVTRNSSRRPW
jgi:hypothetical protein